MKWWFCLLFVSNGFGWAETSYRERLAAYSATASAESRYRMAIELSQARAQMLAQGQALRLTGEELAVLKNVQEMASWGFARVQDYLRASQGVTVRTDTFGVFRHLRSIQVQQQCPDHEMSQLVASAGARAVRRYGVPLVNWLDSYRGLLWRDFAQAMVRSIDARPKPGIDAQMARVYFAHHARRVPEVSSRLVADEADQRQRLSELGLAPSQLQSLVQTVLRVSPQCFAHSNLATRRAIRHLQ